MRYINIWYMWFAVFRIPNNNYNLEVLKAAMDGYVMSDSYDTLCPIIPFAVCLNNLSKKNVDRLYYWIEKTKNGSNRKVDLEKIITTTTFGKRKLRYLREAEQRFEEKLQRIDTLEPDERDVINLLLEVKEKAISLQSGGSLPTTAAEGKAETALSVLKKTDRGNKPIKTANKKSLSELITEQEFIKKITPLPTCDSENSKWILAEEAATQTDYEKNTLEKYRLYGETITYKEKDYTGFLIGQDIKGTIWCKSLGNSKAVFYLISSLIKRHRKRKK